METAPDISARVRVIIADDEPLARRRIRAMLAPHEDFEIVGECADGVETVQMLATLQPDVLLLDIEMPEVSGMALARGLAEPPPIVVFITAYERYAVDAFAVQALDYLLKPFDEERFQVTLKRIRSALAKGRTPASAGRIALADIEVDLRARRAWRNGQQVVLRRREFDVLVRLLTTPGDVVTRDELLRDVWGYKSGVVSRTIDTHVCEVRRKLGHQAGEPGYIETVARFGYRILRAELSGLPTAE